VYASRRGRALIIAGAGKMEKPFRKGWREKEEGIKHLRAEKIGKVRFFTGGTNLFSAAKQGREQKEGKKGPFCNGGVQRKGGFVSFQGHRKESVVPSSKIKKKVYKHLLLRINGRENQRKGREVPFPRRKKRRGEEEKD